MTVFEIYGTAHIPLCGQKGQGLCLIADCEAIPLLRKNKWYLSKNGYVVTNRGLYAHREIYKYFNKDEKIDVINHISGNKLDNRLTNLNNISQQINNQSFKAVRKDSCQPYRGVRQTKTGKWTARIGYNHSSLHLGTFDSSQAAALAYNQKAKELFGPHILLNEVINE